MPSAKAERERRRTEDRRDAVVNLRLPKRTRALIDEAAAARGQTRTQFMLDSARKEATDVLLDRNLIVLSAKDFDAFVEALDNPEPPNERLRRLLTEPAPWER